MKWCTRTVWKTMLVLLSKFSCVLQGLGRDFKGLCGIANPKRIVYSFLNYRKMKYMLEKHEGWHGAMVWPHRAQVKF
jgi:hypothetical protein